MEKPQRLVTLVFFLKFLLENRGKGTEILLEMESLKEEKTSKRTVFEKRGEKKNKKGEKTLWKTRKKTVSARGIRVFNNQVNLLFS